MTNMDNQETFAQFLQEHEHYAGMWRSLEVHVLLTQTQEAWQALHTRIYLRDYELAMYEASNPFR